MIFWALALVVTIKYLTYIMRADNHGEGGVLALLALLPDFLRRTAKGRATLPAILILIGLISTRFAGFVAPSNLANVFNDTAPLIILAVGQMIVILTKCIDLSVAARTMGR